MTLLIVDASAAGERLDRWLAARVADVSRARLQELIDSGVVRVDGGARKRAYRLQGGERVELEVPPRTQDELEPEPIALTVVHEDDDVLVVDKPAGMVVHPGAGHANATLAAAALAHAPAIASVGGARRPGIVHRLDKDTSGLLVIAKTPRAYDALTRQLAARTVKRRYVAIVHGRARAATGVVDAAIGRDPRHRQRMAVRPAGQGKRAVTRWRVVERFPHFTHLDVTLETGRTHQIRVHMASIGHPVVGDRTYGGKLQPPIPLDGLALHAAGLTFVHPASQAMHEFTASIPPRIEALLCHLRNTPEAGAR
ncbi:MAG: RluA family pseudouridine synthase [Candidatus Rokubacteria bacterium]|nr:RluA family pseudouridine synthase [Candidatus Rokubacteria bacterium]